MKIEVLIPTVIVKGDNIEVINEDKVTFCKNLILKFAIDYTESLEESDYTRYSKSNSGTVIKSTYIRLKYYADLFLEDDLKAILDFCKRYLKQERMNYIIDDDFRVY